ncbi:MAG: hypothetical protein ACRC02_18065, partial [Vogesella sp.]|uniref:hypothetical protein n=1 Tax=Vogesella sp. TaxID=1904252 RepID=UPI003F39F4D8
ALAGVLQTTVCPLSAAAKQGATAGHEDGMRCFCLLTPVHQAYLSPLSLCLAWRAGLSPDRGKKELSKL